MRYLVPLGFLLASTTCVAAADFGGPPAYDGSLKDGPALMSQPSWTGFYVGGHVGYAWGEWDGNMLYTDANQIPLVPYGAFDASGKTIDAEGAIAGGQIGFNVQNGSFVWGVEGDASWANLDGGTVMFPFPDDPNKGTAVGMPAWGFDIENKWLATLRARLGYTTGPALFFATGGVAFGGFDITHDVIGYPDPEGRRSSRDDTEVGWVVGGGAEIALGRGWSAKAEYQYIHFSDVGGITKGWDEAYGPPTDGFDGDFDIHTVRLGVNYKFGSGQ